MIYTKSGIANGSRDPIVISTGNARLCCLRCGRPLFTPTRRRSADELLEGAAKCGLRFVTDILSDSGDIRSTTAEQTCRHLHTPMREIVHWRLTDKMKETLGKGRA